jgi:hypothetical protein
MENIIGNVLKFNEHRPIVSSIRLLAQSYIDKGVHPNDFNNGNVKNELIIEYNRRKILQIKELISKMNNVQLIRIKKFLNIKSKKKALIYDSLRDLSLHKLDKIYNFSLQVSNKELKLKKSKGKSEKIHMKVGPNRKTRKKKRH